MPNHRWPAGPEQTQSWNLDVFAIVIDQQVHFMAERTQLLNQHAHRNRCAAFAVERLWRDQQDLHRRSMRNITGEPTIAVTPTARQRFSTNRIGALPLPRRCAT